MAQSGRHRTEITIETQSVTTIRTSGSHRLADYCDTCSSSVTPLTVSQVAAALGQTTADVDNLCQQGLIHLIANSDVCGNSLAAHFGRDIKLIEDKNKQEKTK